MLVVVIDGRVDCCCKQNALEVVVAENTCRSIIDAKIESFMVNVNAELL